MNAAQVGDFATTPDGDWIIYRTWGGAAPQYFLIRLGVDSTPSAVLTTGGNKMMASVSPDGRRLAYAAEQSGQFEVYVRPFPNVETGRRLQVSLNA